MDSLTQLALGAAVGEAVLGKKIGNKAVLYGAIAGTIPDLDVFFSGLMDTTSALLFHRSISHSLTFALLLSVICSWLVNAFEKHKSFKDWFWLFYFCFTTHSLLDAQTTWGTQLLWPLANKFANDNIFIVDFFYTLPLVICLLLVVFKKKSHRLRTRFNTIGLVVSSFYLVLSIALKEVATIKFENALSTQNIEYKSLKTRPSPMNIILWSANIKTETGFLMGHYSIFDKQPITFSEYEKSAKLSPEIAQSKPFKQMEEFTDGWYTISKNNDNYIFNDIRSGAYSFESNANNYVFQYKIFKNEFGNIDFERLNTNPKNLIQVSKALWTRLKGN